MGFFFAIKQSIYAYICQTHFTIRYFAQKKTKLNQIINGKFNYFDYSKPFKLKCLHIISLWTIISPMHILVDPESSWTIWNSWNGVGDNFRCLNDEHCTISRADSLRVLRPLPFPIEIGAFMGWKSLLRASAWVIRCLHQKQNQNVSSKPFGQLLLETISVEFSQNLFNISQNVCKFIAFWTDSWHYSMWFLNR